MTLDDFIEVLRSLWGLWVMIFFGGAVLWGSRLSKDDDKER